MNSDRLVTRFLEAWNSQDVERVLDCYTDELRYRDPRRARGRSPPPTLRRSS